MFGNPIQNDKKWDTDLINNVAPSQNYKGSFEDKVWLLNLDMVESNSGRIIDYVYENINNIGNSTCTFNEENILYSKLRPYLNKVVIPSQKGYATSELVPLKPNKDKLNKYFLAYLLRSEQFVQYISEKVAGAKMPRISMDMFRKFKLILPPIELQNKFAEFVKQIDKQKFATINFVFGISIPPNLALRNFIFFCSSSVRCFLIISSVSSLSIASTFHPFFINAIVSLPAPHPKSIASDGKTFKLKKFITFLCAL